MNASLIFRLNFGRFAHRRKNTIIDLYYKRHSALLGTRCYSFYAADPQPERLGAFFEFVSNSKAVSYVQNMVIDLHDYTGLSWWQTIVATTLIARTFFVLPMAVHQYTIMARLENLNIELRELENKIYKDIKEKGEKEQWSNKKLRVEFIFAMNETRQNLILKYNCHPMKMSVLSLIQIPVWVVLSTVFRNIVLKLPPDDPRSIVAHLQMTVGGLPWVPNLTLPDETWTIPIIIAVLNLSIIQMSGLRKIGQSGKFMKFFKHCFRFGTLIMMYIAAHLNSEEQSKEN